MNMKYIYIYLLALLVFASCYDDKGNDDYKPLNRVTIEKFSAISRYFGDKVELTPVLTFAQDSSEENLEFEWTLWEKKKFKTRNFSYVADTMGTGMLVLRITDKTNGIVYSQACRTTIKSPYETSGYVILSRNANNESILSFIRQDGNDNYGETETNYYNYEAYYSVYEEINNKSLGKDPIKILQHFHEKDDKHDGETGNFWIFQGENNSMDISGVSFEKDVLLKDQFLDGMPAGFEPYDMVDMIWSSFIIGKDGKTYSRKKASKFLFNSGSFLNDPVVFEENGKTYEIDGSGVIHHRYRAGGFTLLYEKNLHRFLLFTDSDQTSAGKIEAPTAPQSVYTPSDAARINNLGDMKMIHCGAYLWDNYPDAIRFYSILQDPNGVFYSYDFGLNNIAYSGAIPAITTVVQKVLPDATQQVLSSIIGNGKNIFNTGYTDPSAWSFKKLIGYVLISHNNELWLLNRATGIITLYDTFEADITAIDTEIYNAWAAGIGLANGKFYVEEVSVASYTNELPRRMFSFDRTFGEEILSIRFKSDESW